MSFGEVPSTTKSSNLPLISPHTPMTTNAMVIVAKGCNMKKKFDMKVKRRDNCHFSGYKKLNSVV